MNSLSNQVLEKVRSFPTLEEAADFFGHSADFVSLWLSGESEIPVSAAEKVFSEPIAPRLHEGKEVCLVLPWYRETNPMTAFSVFNLIDREKVALMLKFGDAFIPHVRNSLAEQFLKSKIEWMLTVDDDMVIPCGQGEWFNQITGFELPIQSAALNSIERLRSHGKTLVGGLYFGRWKHGNPVFAEGNRPEVNRLARTAPRNEIVPTKWVGTGCLLVHRSVFLDIEKTFPHLARDEKGANGHWFTSSEHDLRSAANNALDVLSDPTVTPEARVAAARKIVSDATDKSQYHSGLGVGEDVIFCTRALQAGHQPYVDFGLVCGHGGHFIYGPKRAGWVK